MEANDQNQAQLRELLTCILHPDNNTRKNAEKTLESLKAQKGFPILVLTLVTNLCSSHSPEDISIRQSAAVVSYLIFVSLALVLILTDEFFI